MIWQLCRRALVISLGLPVAVAFGAGPQVEKIKEPTQFEFMKMADEMNIEVHLKEKDKFARFEDKMSEEEEEKVTKSKTQLRMQRQSSSNALNSKLGTPNAVKDHTIMTTIWKHEN